MLDESHITEVSDGARVRARAERQLRSMLHEEPSTHDAPEEARAPESSPPHPISRARQLGHDKLRAIDAAMEYIDRAAKGGGGAANEKENADENRASETSAVNASPAKQVSAEDGGVRRSRSGRRSAKSAQEVDVEKWRAIQTWASVDSVAASMEAANGRQSAFRKFEPSSSRDSPSFAVGDASELPEDTTAADDVMSSRHLLSSVGDPTPAKSAGGRGGGEPLHHNLPDTLSPITQVAEPPVHDDLANVQPAIVGTGDGGDRHRHHRASASKQLARQRRLDDEDGCAAGGDAQLCAASDETPASKHPAWATPGPNGDGTQLCGTRDEERSRVVAPTPPRVSGVVPSSTDAGLALDLEVTRRREREARAAMEKMERAVETLKTERDDAVERAMRASVAADAAHAARDSALSDSRRASTETARLRKKVADAAARLEEDDRELARLRDLLAQQAAAAEDAAGAMSADVAAAKDAREASLRDLEDAEARRAAADRALAELKETHRTFVADAGDQLDQLTSQVAVLKARLSAQDAREAMIADQEAQIEDLRRRLDTACAGVEGPVASALRRARATLRNATSETGPGFAAEHDESFRAFAGEDGDGGDEGPNGGLDLDKAAKARLEATPMLAAQATKLAADVERAADVLAERLCETRERSDDLRRRCDAATEFENGAEALRDAYVKSTKECERLAKELASLAEANESAQKSAKDADDLASAAMEARDRAESAAKAARENAESSVERAEAQTARAEARAAKAELLASAAREAQAEAEAEAAQATAALDAARRREAHAAAAAARATDEIVAKEAAAAAAVSSAEELTAIVTSLKTQVADLKTTLAAAETKAASAEGDANAARDECERALRRAEDAETAAATYKIRADSADADVEVKSERIRELRAAVADALGTRADDEDTVAKLNEELLAIGEKYAAAREEAKANKDALADAAKRVESLEDELATARLLAESATDDAVDAAGEYFAAYAEETQDLVHFLYDGAEKVNAEVASAKRREGEFRGAFAAVLAALDSAVAGAYAPETRADANDPPPVPDFESLAPARLAPPTGKTLDHGLADVTSNAAEDAPAMPRPEGDPDGNGEVDGSNPRALAADEIALAAEARGTWAAKQLSARVHAVVYERTAAATQLAAAREAAANADAAANASDAELASLRSELASAEKRAAEFGEAAAAAKADAARLATEAKELRRSAEDAETKERAILATDAAGKLAAADERASELQSRLDAAEERALSAAAEADAGAARAEEAATAAAEAEAAAAEADGQLAQLAEESERLAGALIESETSAAQYQRAAMEAERRVDELYSDLAALRAFVDVGVSVAEPVFRRVDALRRENLALRARVPMLAQRCVGARGARLKALRERNSAVRGRKSFADAFERGKKKYYELEVAFNETRLAMHDDLRKEKKKAVDARDVADKAAAELDAIVKKQERLRRELKLSVDRHKSTAKESTAKLRDLEQRVAEAESKLRESQVDRAKNSRRAKELEQQCAVLKKSAKAAEKSRASAVAELSAKQAELSEADARLKHAKAAAAAAAAAALASAQGAETLTAKLESQIDSSDRVRELREALTAALEAKAAAEEKLASDVAALEADVKELIFLGSQASTAKKEIGARSTTASSFDLETPASSRTMMPSPTPSEDAAAALSAIHPQRLDLLAATGGGTPMEASMSRPPRLAVVVSDADAVAIAPTPPPPRASHAAADDATDDAGVNTTNNNNTVDLTADMAALEEEAESLRAEVEALRLEVAGARAEAAAGAQRAAVLEDSIARLKRAAAEAESIAAVDSETRLATHAAIEASVTDAIGLAVDVDETDGDVVDGEDLGPESSETPPGATIARAGTPPLPPAAADSPSRRAQLNAAVVSAPRPPSPLGLNAVHGLVATGSLAVDPRERPSQPEEGSLAAALEQMLPINGAAANKMPSRNSSACASANSLASIAEGSSGEEDGEDADADATDGEASVDSPSPAVDNQKGGDFAELETELALRRKLAREASRKAQSLSQECQTLSVALEEAKSAASRFEKRAAAAEKIAANAISHAEVEEERHAACTAELTERCEALAGELRAANESRDAAVKKVEALELRLSDIASDGASATNTRPNTPSPVKGENDPAESVPPEVSEVSEVRLSINVVDGASREREDDLLARAELAESAVAELRAKLESANVRVAAAEDELRAARKTVEETAKTVEETAERADASAETIEELRARVHASDAELVDAKHEADAYRSALADAEAKLVSSAEAEKVNHQSLVRRVDEAEKNLADALARCADMSERRDAAESRAASAGAAADSASAAAAESHAAMLDAERSVEDVKREMEDVKRGAEAEAEALGARLEAALTELADARALAVGLTGSARAADDGEPESFPSDAADDGSAAAEDVADESRGEGELDAGGSGSGSIVAGAPAELLEELVRRRVREAQLEADAAKLRVQLDAAESRLRRTRAELEDSAGKFASDASADSGAGSVAGSDAAPDAALASELAEYKATCAHLRSMLDAKEEALEEVERRAISAAEAAASFAAAAAAATPTRSPPVEKIAEGADPGAVQGAVDQAVVEAAVEKRLAAVGSIIETWRRAVEAKELEITSLAAKIDELEASAANHTENPGSNGDDELAARLAAAEREVRDAADKLAAALLASEDPAPDLAPVSKTKRMPLRVAADAAAARLAYLAKRADVHESETRELVEAQTKATAATHEAAMAKADARLAELARALKESAESEGRALAAAAQSEAAKASAEEAFEKCVDDLRAAERTAEELRARVAAGDSRGERDQGGQARALMLQAECSELRAKVEKRNREVRELNQMLKAWEAMRHSKDQQIAQLVERCRKFEEEAADKARAIDAMRSRLGRGDHRDGQPGGASVGAGSVGSVSFNRTPRRSPTGTSMRLSPSPAPSSVSSFAFGTRAPSGGAAPSPENIDKENPERSPSATKRFAAMAALGGESPGRPAGGSVKGSIDAEVSARVGGGVGASPRGGVPSPKRALRTIGR